MRAVEISAPGPPEVLRLTDRPVPACRNGEVLVRVMAAGVNRPDLLQRLGKYPPPPGASDIPGLEVSGIIEDVSAAGGTALRKGDSVCALVAGGGYAELVAVPAVQCLPIPPRVDWIGAAALPETFFTVWTNVFEDGSLREGETFLVHGGASGIGTTAIQLAHAFGARVLTTAGTDEKCRACRDLGADVAINYRERNFVEDVLAATGGRGVDLVLDMVGGDYTQRNLEVLAPRGRLVQIAFLRAPRAEINFSTIMQKRLSITGSTLRARPPEEKGRIARELETKVWPLFGDGRLRPVIHAVFPLDRAADAHRELERGEHVGKIVLSVDV